jgi:N-acetylmuramoyl-L-alanine amidase
VLARLRVAEASNHSARLAQLVHAAIISRTASRHRGFQDLGIKKGPFYVLFLSSMPSILVETGFVTNRGDVKLLRDASFHDTLAEQIAMGLMRYREGGRTLTTGVGG